MTTQVNRLPNHIIQVNRLPNHEVVTNILDWLRTNSPDIGRDSEGQIIIYTGLFEQADGSLNLYPEASR